MSVTLMAASCDSIGSCSLDVDAESLADSLVDSAQVDSSLNRRNAGEHQANAPSLSEQTLHSLFLSTSTNSGGQNTDNFDKIQSTLSSSSPTAKKPSYLNLACSISGYGGITTYDSKLREGFRSREHSPGKLIGIQNGSREASPARGLVAGSTNSGNFLTAPNSGRLCWTPSPVSGQLTGRSEMKHISPTFGGGRHLNGTNGTDQTDATGNFNIKRLSDQRNRWLESTLSPLEKNKDYHKVVSVVETKSDIQGLTSETSVETRYEINSRNQSTVISSTTIVSSSSKPHQEYCSSMQAEKIIPISVEGDSSDRYGHLLGKPGYTNGSSLHHAPASTKSFIQQRVERLYGPGALAQGFFHRSSKYNECNFQSSLSSPFTHGANGFGSQVKTELKSTPIEKEISPELPVLRHLRPEFRDQLTVAPRRSLGSRFSNGSSPSNVTPLQSISPSSKVKATDHTPQLQQQISTESIADLQPAAPEVVLPQQSPAVSPMAKIDETLNDKLKSDTKVSMTQESAHLPKSSKDKSCASSQEKLSADDVKEENAGHKFLKIQRQTIEKLLQLAEKAEQEIKDSGSNGNPVLPEEALGHLRAAAGQARLLATQKMVQFEGLCRKCTNQRPDEPFPTTAEDLQGFWDMLLLQVDQVHSTFQRLDKLKEVDWCEDKLPPEDIQKITDSSGPNATTSVCKRTPRSSKSTPMSAAKSAEATALRKQREEERRKLMEQRRRELKQKQQGGQDSSASNETVEIFGAQPS